jgi:hypothetical protein
MEPTDRPFLDPFMAPERQPEPYHPGADVVAWRPAANGNVVIEVFRRGDESYGYRYKAWVAWRDAGGEARDHSWWECHPVHALVSTEQDVACKIAMEDARTAGLEPENAWRSAG